MGKQYIQLDLDDRIEPSRLHEDGKALSEITRIMGRHLSTIGRNLKQQPAEGRLQAGDGGSDVMDAARPSVAAGAPDANPGDDGFY